MQVVPALVDVELPQICGGVDDAGGLAFFAHGVREACAEHRGGVTSRRRRRGDRALSDAPRRGPERLKIKKETTHDLV
jgi:hypothetical protein